MKLEFNSKKTFPFYHSGAFRTTSTAAFQVIEGILPLHIKAKTGAAYKRTTRFRMPSHFQNSTFQSGDFDAKCFHSKIHLSGFLLDSRISSSHQTRSASSQAGPNSKNKLALPTAS
ncbi:hypothetical protein AVEN_192503-1 [Araneus ventricosus]|uniref:Uncharacterized protein n=1 Tax=Araneus ventricosus TaxID=182803 RepID=A0A4Y2RTB4_ARAVE|nr:hypothetical protein AVEN_74779-1 [Araneus ventricosus]GBN78998.1 hypothetical protein AVEN_185442-1 [Araneus ventricosus]GBN79002.1 hypothetical protein AVEN_222007-1 [Araneus ventricosus]GBN79007.1 hypothetical protein AVEN_192503-1 [Araneus ventricosus]